MFRTLFSVFRKLHFRSFVPFSTTAFLLHLPQVQCQNLISFAKKAQITNILSSSKEQTIMIVCNQERKEKLEEELQKVTKKCEKLGIKQIIFVDQTDLRHLKLFERLLKEEASSEGEPHDLDGEYHIYYIHPFFDTSKPFSLESVNTVESQVYEVRKSLQLNPTYDQVKRSINTFNRTTVIKNCYSAACIADFKQKVRNLLNMELLRDKLEEYRFFMTTGKNEAAKVSELLPKSSSKEETFAMRNDILGQQSTLFSEWLKNKNNKEFLMFIKPRVHLITHQNYMNDLYWYMKTINNNAFTFSINNTLPGGKPQQIQLLKDLKKKYQNQLQLMVINTTVVSELLRHVVQPWRYVVFQMGRNVPYPKLKVDPESIHQQIDKFMKEPKNYDPIKMYCEKERQINVVSLPELIEKKRYKWMLRICSGNRCLKSAYEMYGLDLATEVYKTDKETQNIGIDDGDYWVEDGQLQKVE